LVSPAELTRLQQIACTFEYYGQTHDCSTDPTPGSVTALGSTFEAAAPALQHTTDSRLNRLQAQDMLRFVREGRENADYLVVALRAGQLDDARSATPRAPKFLEEIAHAAVDSGADLVTMTGRSTLGPIEIYWARGRPPRPIFYGLGNFYWSPGQGPSGSDSTNTWSVIAQTQIFRKQLVVDLYPIDLSADATHIPGSPRLAERALATTILQRLIQLSAPYGVVIKIEPSGATVRGHILEEGEGDKP
jgi:poly-gamma-glutamate capsule biosynthesis protein CapA/YwtB (metallophosphatase superfamily)